MSLEIARMSDTEVTDAKVALHSQASYQLGSTTQREASAKESYFSPAGWLTHKIKRQVRSTVASESAGANERLEAADISGSHC